VSGDVHHAFVHEMVEELSHKALDTVDTSNSGSATEVQHIEEIEED
jgi:hypothetical protein